MIRNAWCRRFCGLLISWSFAVDFQTRFHTTSPSYKTKYVSRFLGDQPTNRTFILTVAAQCFIIMAGIPDLIPRMCQTSIQVPSIGAGVHEGHGGVERCLPSIWGDWAKVQRWHPVSPRKGNMELIFWTVHSPLQVQFFFGHVENISSRHI